LAPDVDECRVEHLFKPAATTVAMRLMESMQVVGRLGLELQSTLDAHRPRWSNGIAGF